MVEVTFLKTDRGYEEFHLSGHAGYNPGNDIVCSAISGLAYTLLGALDNVEFLDKRYIHIESGKMDIEINPFMYPAGQKEVDTIFKTVLIGLLQIEAQYPDHIKVKK